MNRHFGDVVQVIATEKMRIFGEFLPAMIAGFKRTWEPLRVLFNLHAILLAQCLFTFRITFYHVAGLLFNLHMILL
jgi:hypothetical protein